MAAVQREALEAQTIMADVMEAKTVVSAKKKAAKPQVRRKKR